MSLKWQKIASSFGALSVFVVVITLVVALIQLANLGVDWLRVRLGLNTANKPPQQQTSSVAQYFDYDALSSMKKVRLVENFSTFTPRGKLDNNKISKGLLLKEGKLIKGYIDVRASINGSPLTFWESIYLKFGSNRRDHFLYGAHLFKYNSLPVPLDGKTHMLFPLSDMPFVLSSDYNENTKVQHANIFNLINEGKSLSYLSFISSLSPALIESIDIYYQCDPTENDGNCELVNK